MKRAVLIAVLMVRMFTAAAQDTIYLKDGSVRCAWITEESPALVKVRFCNQPNGLIRTFRPEEIWKIRYGYTGETKFFYDMGPQGPTVQGKSSYAGPRVGMTYVGPGVIQDKLAEDNKAPMLSQFGWQFETRFFKTKSGVSGLFEFVPMIGGMEQGMFLPSASFLIGMRFEDKDCLEFGLGPNLSQSGLGMVFAAGTSFHVGEVYFPVNLALLPSVGKTETFSTSQGERKVKYETGLRITLTVGFNIRKS